MTTSKSPAAGSFAGEDAAEIAERFALVMDATSEGWWDYNAVTGEVIYSPRWKELLGYQDHELPNRNEEWIERVHPDDYPRVSAVMDAYIAGQTPKYDVEYRLRHRDGHYRWVHARGVMRRDERGSPLRFVGSYADITERKHAEDRSREDRRKLFTLMSNLPGMAYRCRNEPGWPMMFVSEGATTLTGHTPDEMLASNVGYGSLIHPDDAGMVWEQVQAALDARRPFQMTYRIIDAAGTEKWVWEQGCGVWRDDGSLRVLEGFITDVTDRVNAFRHLEQAVDEKTRELRLLLDITHDVAGLLDLRPLTRLILDRVKEVVEYDRAALFVLDDDGDTLNALHYVGPMQPEQLAQRWRLSTHDHARVMVESGRPVIIRDVFDDSPLAQSMLRNLARDVGEIPDDYGTWMGVPLLLGERVTGMLAVVRHSVGYYTEQHAELMSAVANQAAVAIENARLFEQVRGLAALEERQKLARELHDSVSQALYGIGLGARTARTLLARDPARVNEPLDYVISLAEAGLAEMRALIFELRPDALETEGITGLLDKQAAAIRARHGIQVEIGIPTEPDLPLAVKETLYRIAQESLNNTIKHARAGRVDIRLSQSADGVTLEIADDGQGFDPGGRFPGHLGLRSMRERAARHGATLEIDSAPGQGTRVRVIVLPAT